MNKLFYIVKRCKHNLNSNSDECYNTTHLANKDNFTLCGHELNTMWYIEDILLENRREYEDITKATLLKLITCRHCRNIIKEEFE